MRVTGAGPDPTIAAHGPRASRASSPPARSTSATYLGALRQLGRPTSTTHDAVYCIVDLHALTVPQDPAELRAKHARAGRRCCSPSGSTPTSCTLFVQSHVPEHAELAWLMECTASFGELQPHDPVQGEVRPGQEFVSAGLFTYPALMAADILLYDTDQVPVGDDQRQHVELTRDVADPVQQPLRRHVRGARGRHPQGRRPGDGPAGPDAARCRSPTTRPRAPCCMLDDPTVDREEVQAGGHRHRRRGPLRPRGQAGRVEPAVDPRPPPPAATPRRSPTGYTQYGPLKADTADAVVELLRPIQARYPSWRPTPARPHAAPRPRAPTRRGRSPAADAGPGPGTPSASSPPA